MQVDAGVWFPLDNWVIKKCVLFRAKNCGYNQSIERKHPFGEKQTIILEVLIMNKVVEFLNANPVQYLATVGRDGKAKCRPFMFAGGYPEQR